MANELEVAPPSAAWNALQRLKFAVAGRRIGRAQRPQSSERRLVFFLVPFLIAFQIGGFALVWLVNRRIAGDNIEDQLSSSTQVFAYAAGQRREYLKQATELVSKDQGFRAAVTNNSRRTVESALINQNARVGANLTVLTDLQGDMAGYAKAITRGYPTDFSGLTDETLASQVRDILPGGDGLSVLQLDAGSQILYQWVKAVVNTPEPVGYLTFGFQIDDQIATQFRQITNSEFVFFSRDGATEPWQERASSVGSEVQHALNAGLDRVTPEKPFANVRIGAADYRMMVVKLSSNYGQEVAVVVARPLDRVLGSFERLERVFAGLICFNVLLSAIAVYRGTRKIVAPLDQVAFQDSLTGLANRRLFELNLKLAAENLRSLGRGYALMVMDLNKFKAVNDTLGHAAGDQVLKEAAHRLHAVLRASDTVARLGGDEFAVLLVTADSAKAVEIAALMVERVRQPMTLADGKVVEVGVSIGIARAPDNGTDTTRLMQLADDAMYAAKVGRSGYSVTPLSAR
ncbi:diguanylate cyclase [Xylophilus rhododendri]|uniref:Diguanylate cyclase n=1 Tax=Xylophilus rhododendri TaxID=2697032 RepID=A0A857J9L0_9BURK|nr:diguanylate cyclase [Xylophilus rhododendri]QHJ00685.1 diguanylate cyclase [Xylophilus rhododendri]